MTKNALITGAARRIGAACARVLHRAGYDLVLHYKNSEADALHLSDELNAIRENSVFLVKADLSQQGEVQQLAEKVAARADGVDLLVNNASWFHSVPFGQVKELDWDLAMSSNLKAPFFLSQALWPALKSKCGCIVNIVDIHAETGLPGYPAYSIAKAGLVALTRCLAKEMAPEVRVNAVAPGAILWPELGIAVQEQAEILQRVALQRCGEASDIAAAVRFLADDAAYTTGQVLNVDGGRTLFR
ncbi:pteridine reductase [Methylomonas sp. 2BW1-5-20]|uniref:pteridine reductase n=1 Tax=Methylomonas sp. 2BW1-5-20 TaxID=3376686 RepID=UPI00404C057A